MYIYVLVGQKGFEPSIQSFNLGVSTSKENIENLLREKMGDTTMDHLIIQSWRNEEYISMAKYSVRG